MKELLDIANQIDYRLGVFLSSYIPMDKIRGVLLQVDRFWMQGILAKKRLTDFLQPCPVTVRWLRLYHDWQLPLDSRPPRWEEHCKALGYLPEVEPVLIKVVLSDPYTLDNSGGLPRQFEGYQIIYEYRPPCVAYAGRARSIHLQAAHSIGARLQPKPSSGTAGGFLQQYSSRTLYLVSCWHVLGPPGTPVFYPSPQSTKNSVQVGTVTFAAFPRPRYGASPCNRINYPEAGRVDIALAQINQGVGVLPYPRGVGPIDQLTPIEAMSPFDKVIFVGRKSKRVEAELGALCLWYQIDIGDTPYCFHDLFELTPRRPWYLNQRLAQPGDSGAWVLNLEGGVVGWDGMIIGGDGDHVYCCFAQNILDECHSVLPDLALPTTSEQPERAGEASDEQIKTFAYMAWESNGRPDGRAHDDWFEACRLLEREITLS